MLNLPFFGKKKLLLAFEYGVILSETAKTQGVELSKEHVERAEVMILNEAKTQTASRMATQMEPNILTVFELDLSK